MNDFFISYRAYRNNYLYGEGGFIVICSCGLNGIAAAILNKVNEQIKEGEDKWIWLLSLRSQFLTR